MCPRAAPPSLADLLRLRAGSFVSVIGAGGKTTTILALSSELATRGHRVLITTTTKMWPPEGVPLLLARELDDPVSQLSRSFDVHRVIALGDRLTREGKVAGPGPESLCALRLRHPVILCEADGAAGRPLKAHGPGEPVVPACSTHFLVVAGLDAVGAVASVDTVHRLERYVEELGGQQEKPIGAGDVARLAVGSMRFAPAGAERFVVLNKADSAPRLRDAELVAIALGRLGCRAPVLATARGRPAAPVS